MSSSKLLQSITIKTPCSANWDEMRGSDQVRLCEHCDLSVTDISRLTPQAAIKLVLRSGGCVCLRIHRTPAGELITRSTTQRLHTISRRASRIAAGAFTAVMGLSSAAYAQSSSSPEAQTDRPVATAAMVSNALGGNIWLHGKVMDANGAMIPAAKVTIRNKRTNETQETTSSEEGAFGVWVIEGESYNVLFESVNFINFVFEHVTSERILQGPLDAELSPAGAVNGGAMFTIEYTQPLVQAALANDLAEVAELLRQGADPNREEEDGTTALAMALAHGNLTMSQLLIKSGARADRSIFWINQADDPELLDLLIRSGANVNSTTDDGSTALIVAAYRDGADFVRTLIAAGASVNSQNFAGDSALMIAATEGNEEVVKTLLAAGASLSLRNSQGQDALQLALENERDEVCDVLRAAGAVQLPAAATAAPASDAAPAP